MNTNKFRAWDKNYKCFVTFPSVFLDCDGVAVRFAPIYQRLPDVVIQKFSGLLINGKEIFEGDIIKFNGKLGTVVLHDGAFQLRGPFEPNYTSPAGNNVYYWLVNCLSIETDDSTIEQPTLVGNIFENSSLFFPKDPLIGEW